ncbi:MAG TPA: FAD-dependent oxidoreductase [Solirubrobacteraceae bacterium]|jgi:sulfide:quinone oxidoreductase|nr:FAD-dependent oxidoreductase [Solirubrobacteraceae bacterium]
MAHIPHAETAKRSHSDQFRVVIIGGGVAAVETALALADLARNRTDVTLVAPNTEFVYRPMVVCEPFAHGAARRYPLTPIVRDAGATLLHGELDWIDPVAQTIHTKADEAIEYDALVLALGASISKRYKYALTIDDRDLDETMHGLIQDVEGDFIHKLAFVAPGRMAWPLPLYELALMTAGRAYDMGIDLQTTIVTPEDSPLAIFGRSASGSIAELLARASIETITSAYAEVPNAREVVINPGDRHLEVDRVIALPELFGPELRGIPLGDHGFIRVDPYCRVPGIEHIYAAGDVTDFPIKHGGIGSQQADTAAQSIAALAGASVTPQRFNPMIHGMLLTNGKPQYLTAHITGGHGFSSEITDAPTWSPPSKIAAKYLAPYLQERDRESTST